MVALMEEEMTDYDHDKAKVLYPAGAAEVERLRDLIRCLANEAIDAGNDLTRAAMDAFDYMHNADP